MDENASATDSNDHGLDEQESSGESPKTLVHVDPELQDQIRRCSIGSSIDGGSDAYAEQDDLQEPVVADLSDGSPKAQSPFGAITSSLSLIEMVVRLASLQEFQQASHLAIPDHIMSFFLEESSTTGLVGEAQWKARNDTKNRIGFDPYDDKATT